MRTWALGAVCFLFASSLMACGYTVGESCTTASDCGGQLCLNQANTPGGYCSVACSSASGSSAPRCPNGSVCVPRGADPTMGAARQDACFHTCRTKSDCREGYQCGSWEIDAPTVCIGTQGF